MVDRFSTAAAARPLEAQPDDDAKRKNKSWTFNDGHRFFLNRAEKKKKKKKNLDDDDDDDDG
jgi:hypothetical protein